jgi:hypothetical protein
VVVDDDSHGLVNLEHILHLFFVGFEVLFNKLNDVLSMHSLICIHCEAALQNLFQCWALYSFFEEFTQVGVPIKLAMEDIVFSFVWTSPIERIFLSNYEVNATTQAPNVYLGRKVILFEYQFRSWIIYVTREVVSLEQFFEVEWETNSVKFDDLSLIYLNSWGMHISMGHLTIM